MRRVACLLFLVLALAGCGPAARPMKLKALEVLVMGRTSAEVSRLLGPPDNARVDLRPDGTAADSAQWYYKDMVQEVPGGPKQTARLWVVSGRIGKVDLD